VVAIVADRISEPDAQNGFILDGFPRTVPQAEALDRMLEEKGLALDAVIELKVDEGILLQRIESRVASMAAQGEALRPDDNPESLKKRLDAYRVQTAPLTEYYAGKGMLGTVDGMASIDDVTTAIAEILKQGIGTAERRRPMAARTAAARKAAQRRSARWPLTSRTAAKKPAAATPGAARAKPATTSTIKTPPGRTSSTRTSGTKTTTARSGVKSASTKSVSKPAKAVAGRPAKSDAKVGRAKAGVKAAVKRGDQAAASHLTRPARPTGGKTGAQARKPGPKG
jgi:adenylate kinase